MKKNLLFTLIFSFGLAFSQTPSDSLKNRAKIDSLFSAIDVQKKKLDNLIDKEMSNNNLFRAKNLNELSESDLKGFNVEYDPFKKTNFIYFKSAWTDKFYPYIALSDAGFVSLRLVTRYRGSSWVFYDKVQIIIDNQVYTIEVEPKRDLYTGSGYTVQERSDNSVDPETLNILKKIGEATEKLKIRFSGEKERNTVLYAKEAEITKRILELFEKLKME